MPKVTEEYKEQRRQQILQAALKVFIEKGYEKASLKDILEVAGMSRGWIYLYFESKFQIFVTLIQEADKRFVEQIDLSLKRDESAWETLVGFLEDYKETISSVESGLYPAIYEFFVTGWREPEIREFFSKRYEFVVTTFSKLIEKGIHDREFEPIIQKDEIVKRLISSIDGLIINTLAFGLDQAEPSKQIDNITEWLEQMLHIKK